MIRKIFLCAALISILVGCSSDSDSPSLAPGSNGVASLSGAAVVGGTLSASVTDNEGVQAGTESYQWYSDGAAIAGATSSSYTLTANEGGELVTVVVRYTDAARNRETVESAPMNIQAAFALGARYVHGLVDLALCTISAVDSGGAAVSPALASGTTSAGLASFGALVPVDGTALISCSGGTYVDESTGFVLDAPVTRAVVNVTGEATFTVSPLTEIATRLAEAAGDLNTAITTYNNAIAGSFGLFPNDITQIVPTDLATTAASDDVAGRYATALALISQLDADAPGATAGDIINDLSADLEDGTFSQPSLDALNAAVMNLGSSAVAGNLNAAALSVVESAVNNAPEPAVFGAESLSATVPNDQTTPLTGTVTLTDVNFGENRVTAQTGTQTTYGTFSIAENGAWTYDLNTADATVAGLQVGESVNDTIALTSVDGTPANLVIRITALTQVAKITNTINGDTGELRLDLATHQQQGKLSFSFLKTDALADDGNEKDAYITLYGSSGSSSESLVDLRIQGPDTDEGREPRFLVRNTDNAAYPGDIITAPFTPNEFYEIEIMWDMSQANQITILINGEVLGGGAFSTAAVVDSDFTDLNQWFSEGVERIQWRFGDNGTTIPFGSYLVDNIKIYSDVAGTALVYEDDFEGYNAGDSLASVYGGSVDAVVEVFDAGASNEPVPATFFDLTGFIESTSTELLTGTVIVLDPDPGEAMLIAQATVAAYGTFMIDAAGNWEYDLDTLNPTIAALGSGESVVDTIAIASIDGTMANVEITIRAPVVVPSGLQAAVIRDTLDSDTGELRYNLDTPQLSGRLEVTFDRTVTGLDGFIALLNSTGSTSSERSIIDMRIKSDRFEFRDQTFALTPGVVPTPGTLQTVVITWTAPDDVTPPTVTVTVDGVNIVDGGTSFTSGVNAIGGVERVQFRYGSNGDVTDPADTFTIERFEVFSDTAGTTSVFADDFSGYTVGNSLDPDIDPLLGTPDPATPYNSSSSEVVVESLDAPVLVGAVIRDTDPTDTGELRYDLPAPQLSGRLEVTFDRTVTGLDGFIALLNSTGSTSSERSIIDMRIKSDRFEFRDQTFALTPGVVPTPGTLQTVVITWTAPDDVTPPTVTVTVDGVNIVDGGTSFTSGVNAIGGVERVQFRYGSNGDVTDPADTFTIERFEVFSDTAGTTSVFADDFSGYTVGNSLDPNIDPLLGTPDPATPYNSSSSEVVVETLGGPALVAAVIRDTDPTDTGELRYDLPAPQLSGRLEVTFDRTVTGLDGFIALLNSTGSTSSERSIIDMRIKSDRFEFRDQTFALTPGVVPTPGTLQTVVITWTAPDDVTPPTVTVTVDGVNIVDGGTSFTSGVNAIGGVERVQFRYGSNGDVTDPADTFTIERFEVFSDTAGTTSVFADDFSGYTVGNSLDPDIDPLLGTPDPATPYNSSSSEVVVETLGGQ